MSRKKLNNKGFAVSSVLYTLLIAFLLFLGAALAQFSSSARILSKADDDLTDSYTELPYNSTKQELYQIRIYYNTYGGTLPSSATNYKLNGEYIVPANSKYSFFTASNIEAGNKIYEQMKFPYLPKSGGSDGFNIIREGYTFSGWKTMIRYWYKNDDGESPGVKELIGNFLTLKSINKYVRRNNPTGVPLFIQVHYTAVWKKN